MGRNTVDKVLAIAAADIGYLEKSAEAYRKNPDVIWEKTAGAGSDNITKFGLEMHRIYPAIMDFPAPWCDAAVDDWFYKAYGVTTAKSLLGGNFDDYTVASAQMYKNHGALDENPALGAQVFFTKNGQVSGCYHTGLTCAVDGTYFYTIEGNTSGASGVVANGGGVAKKKYSISAYRSKVLFGHPKYDVAGGTKASGTNSAATAGGRKTLSQIADEVIVGKWGTGDERRKRLASAGYSYMEVQAAVNAKLNVKNPLMRLPRR